MSRLYLGTNEVRTDTGSVPIGAIMAWGAANPPVGWLICDGTAISRTTYAALFAILGTLYGAGDGSTTFAMPDFRDYFLRGASASRAVGSVQTDAMQGHFHTGSQWLVSWTNPSGPYLPASAGTLAGANVHPTVQSPITDGTNGTPRTAAETRPVNKAVNWIIKALDTTASVPQDAAAIVASTSGLLIPADGWVRNTWTWEYVSAAAPNYVIRVNANLAGVVSLGWRVMVIQGGVYKYGIVVAIGAYTGGYSTLTIYCGTQYTIANTAISTCWLSPTKAPVNFPINPVYWTIEVTDTAQLYQTAPTAGTYYNIGSLHIHIPTGAWRISMKVAAQILCTTAGRVGASVILSTAAGSVAGAFIHTYFNDVGVSTNDGPTHNLYEECAFTAATDTVVYLNMQGSANVNYTEIRGDFSPTLIRAVSAYL